MCLRFHNALKQMLSSQWTAFITSLIRFWAPIGRLYQWIEAANVLLSYFKMCVDTEQSKYNHGDAPDHQAFCYNSIYQYHSQIARETVRWNLQPTWGKGDSYLTCLKIWLELAKRTLVHCVGMKFLWSILSQFLLLKARQEMLDFILLSDWLVKGKPLKHAVIQQLERGQKIRQDFGCDLGDFDWISGSSILTYVTPDLA